MFIQLWVLASCGSGPCYWCFTGTCCFHHQGSASVKQWQNSETSLMYMLALYKELFINWYVRFDVLTETKMLMLIFWFIMPCGLVHRHQWFIETYCLYLQSWSSLSVKHWGLPTNPHGITTQNIDIKCDMQYTLLLLCNTVHFRSIIFCGILYSAARHPA
jgi:hypothetical protein